MGGPKGKAIEYLGWYNPLSKKYSLKKERISYWLSQGAQTSDSLYNLLVKDGIITGKKKIIKIKPQKKAKEEKKSEDSLTEADQQTAKEDKEVEIKAKVETEIKSETEAKISESVTNEEIAKE